MTTAQIAERKGLYRKIRSLPDSAVIKVVDFIDSIAVAEDSFQQVPPEIEDVAFQALAFENAESWL